MSKRSAQRTRKERREREGEKKLEAMQVKALDTVEEIVERATKPGESVQPRFTGPTGIFSSVYRWALSCMSSEPSKRAPMREWDKWFRETVRSEPFLASVYNGAVQIDVNRGWELTGGRNQVARYTKVLNSLDRYIKVGNKYLEGNTGGWRAYSSWQSQSYYATRMGFVSEVGRAGRDGPLFTMWSVDPARCELTGNPVTPLKYYPSTSGTQEWQYDTYIRKCSLISTDESALGYGFPAVERCYNLAKIMVGVLSHYMQKLGTRTPDAILTGKYISQDQWETAIAARNESLNASVDTYINSIATIMNSGGDMPEFLLTTLSSLPDRWDIDLWTKILMRGYESAFGYKGEFTYENAGVLGRGNEVEIQHRNATAMGGKDFSLAHQGELQRLLPPTLEFAYDERDINGDIEEAQLSLAKAQVITELSNWVEKSGGVEQSRLTTDQILQLAAEQGIIPEDWTPTEEDVTATDEEQADSERVYRACMAFPNEPIVRYSWPSGKTRTLYRYGADVFVRHFTFSAPMRQEPMPKLEPPIVRETVVPNFTLNMAAQPAPVVNLPPTTVNVAPASVTAIMPEQQRQEPPIVNVNVEAQDAPIVNLPAPVVNVDVAGPVVNVPQAKRQEPPSVIVNVPQQPVPVVNMAAPVVNVAPAPVILQVANSIAKVVRDGLGKISEIDTKTEVTNG